MRISPAIIISLLLIGALWLAGCSRAPETLSRPEAIVSMRQVCYDQTTYQDLATRWSEYYRVFPSEAAYANWMYAARYAKAADYMELLENGVQQYPANPTLLYLYSMRFHGQADCREATQYLERAIKLAPDYSDPWFSLVINYMQEGEIEQMDLALAKLLELDAIQDVVMDYNHNVLALLEPNAILITNGDNDTYPGWVLQRVLDYRTDVTIVNRSLLNTVWYVKHLLQQGELRIIELAELERLREQTPPPWSDTLIVRLAEMGVGKRVPVYFAHTLYSSPLLEPLQEGGDQLGLCTRITPPLVPRVVELELLARTWLEEFRCGSLQSWGLRYAKRMQSPRWLVTNYGGGLVHLLEDLQRYTPDRLLPLFDWYREWILPLVELEMGESLNSAWCQVLEDPVGCDWCRVQGLLP